MGLKKPPTDSYSVPESGDRRKYSRDLPGLTQQLRSTDASDRRWAARDLAHHPEACAVLADQLLREHDSSVRAAIFTSLGHIATPDAAGALLPLLRSEDAELRNSAIETLTAMPQAVGPRIAVLLEDPDVDVRIFTVNLLGDLRHPEIGNWLNKVLMNEAAVNVVAAAIEVIAEVGAPEHEPVLRAAAQRFKDDPFIGFAADVAIERIQSP